MNENEICNILVRIQEIEKLQTELRNLLPRVNNRVHIEKPVESTNLERESSSSIRFPSLLTFSGVTESSSVKKNDRSFRDIRPSMTNMKKRSLKNVAATKRASLNTINDSFTKFYRTDCNKELPNISENSVKTRQRDFQSSHSRSVLNDKKTSQVSTTSERIVKDIPKVLDPARFEKRKRIINRNNQPVNINKNEGVENEEKLSEDNRKSKLSSAMEFTIHSSYPQTSDLGGHVEKFGDNRRILVCQGTQTERKGNNDDLSTNGRNFKYDVLGKILKRLGYCILDDQTVSFITRYSIDKTRHSNALLRDVKRSPFLIFNKRSKNDEILPTIDEVIVCQDYPTNDVDGSNLGGNMATICKIVKRFNGIDKIPKIFRMSLKGKGFLETLRRNSRSTKSTGDNLNDPLYLTLDRNLRSESLEAIETTSSSRRKEHPLKFLRKICICINL